MCKFLLTGCLQVMYNNLFANICATCPNITGFQNYQNQTAENGSKQRFCLLQEK